MTNAEPTPETPHLVLFISGASSVSALAVQRVKRLCDRHYPDGYDLEIIDIHQQPTTVASWGVVATPTLIKEAPPPKRRLIGDLNDEPRVLAALGLPGSV